MENDTAKLFDKVIDFERTPSGHYFIPIRDCNIPIEDVRFAIEDKSYEDKKRIVQKLHRQFAHPSARNLKDLMKNADAVDSEVNEIIEQISNNCNICKRFKRTPTRPVVCMPLANKFNQVIAMDLKHFIDGVYFLHLIDLFHCLSQIITRKLPSVIVDAVIKSWIALGFGAPRKFLIDNEGKFTDSI